MRFCLPAVEPFIKNRKYIEKLEQKSKFDNKKIIFTDKIEIRNLTYKFPNTNENILHGLDLQIKRRM